jgi:hypothetical protein
LTVKGPVTGEEEFEFKVAEGLVLSKLKAKLFEAEFPLLARGFTAPSGIITITTPSVRGLIVKE